MEESPGTNVHFNTNNSLNPSEEKTRTSSFDQNNENHKSCNKVNETCDETYDKDLKSAEYNCAEIPVVDENQISKKTGVEPKNHSTRSDFIRRKENGFSDTACDQGDGETETPTGDADGLPIDRGWAWMILAGSFLNVVLMIGYGRSLGILFVEYLKIFEASATKTTLFLGVMAGMFSISSLFSMNVLLQLIGVRKVVLLGGTITAVGMFTAVFATSITYLICTHSILIGIGHSMIFGPSLVLISQYFKRWRGLATAISMCGISVGGAAFPPLVRYFVDEYGIRGSMLLLTGMTMNLWVGAALYRPLESFRTRKPARTKRYDKDDAIHCETNEESVELRFATNENSSEKEAFISHSSRSDRVRPLSQTSEYSQCGGVTQSQFDLYRSNPELTSLSLLDVRDGDKSVQDNPAKPKTVCDFLKMAIAPFDFSLFKHPMFQLIVVISNFGMVFALASVYVPALAKEKGVPKTEASLLLTISGSLDFCSRLAIGYIADLKRIKVHSLIAIGVFVAGTATHFTAFYDSYPLLVMYAVLIGLFGNFYNCLISLFIIELMGQEKMAKVLGFATLFHGLSMSLAHPIIGTIRDLTGTYSNCYNFIAMCNYMAALCLVCEPVARRRAKRLNLLNEESNP